MLQPQISVTIGNWRKAGFEAAFECRPRDFVQRLNVVTETGLSTAMHAFHYFLAHFLLHWMYKICCRLWISDELCHVVIVHSMFVVFQPDSNHNQSRLNSSDKTDGDQVTPEQVIRNRLLSKINRTNEQLISEQNAKQCTCVYVTRHMSNSDVIFFVFVEHVWHTRTSVAFKRLKYHMMLYNFTFTSTCIYQNSWTDGVIGSGTSLVSVFPAYLIFSQFLHCPLPYVAHSSSAF